jgi:hypothetical protein
MLSSSLRPAINRLVDPAAGALARTPLTPDALTIIGTVGMSAGALALFPTGHLFAGTMVCAVFVLADTFDGALARAKGTTSVFGGFLDSTLDRIGDAAVFSGLAAWFVLGCSAWSPARWCHTRKRAPRASACAATSVSPSGQNGCLSASLPPAWPDWAYRMSCPWGSGCWRRRARSRSGSGFTPCTRRQRQQRQRSAQRGRRREPTRGVADDRKGRT